MISKPLLATLACAALAACSPVETPTQIKYVPERARTAVDEGPLEREEVLRLVIGLKLHDEELLVATRRGKRILSPTEFADRHAPSSDAYSQIVEWLDSAGFTIVRTAPGRTTITVEASADVVERAFKIHLRRFNDLLGRFHAPDAEPKFPDVMQQYLGGVVGLDDSLYWTPHVLAGDALPDATGKTGANTPQDLQLLYNVGMVAAQGEGETVAILATNTPPDPVGDIGMFMSNYKLPALAMNQYTQVFVGGPNRDGAQGNAYIENVLDPEMVLSFAPKANVVHVFTATNSPGLFTDGISYIVNQVSAAHAVSLSYGDCERFEAPQMPVLNALFAQARAEGQQWFAASGDTGTDGCRDGAGNKILSIGWPAASPGVIGVGGTQQDGNGKEQAWGVPGGAGGGGVSESLDKPPYQIGVNPFPNDGARHEPDVAGLAGSPYVEIVSKGMTIKVGGTSCAAPMWAGIWSLIDQSSANGKGITDGMEELYTLGGAGMGVNDITVGNNSDGTTPGYPALPGWDFPTGWGTPNVTALIANWK